MKEKGRGGKEQEGRRREEMQGEERQIREARNET